GLCQAQARPWGLFSRSFWPGQLKPPFWSHWLSRACCKRTSRPLKNKRQTRYGRHAWTLSQANSVNSKRKQPAGLPARQGQKRLKRPLLLKEVKHENSHSAVCRHTVHAV